MLICRHCLARQDRDAAWAMACGSCNALPGVPCAFGNKREDTHDAREQTALFYRFAPRCPARKGRQPHQFQLACAAAPPDAQAADLPLFSLAKPADGLDPTGFTP